MKSVVEKRVKWLHVRLTEDEFLLVRKAYSATTQRKFSDYARAILLGKPMIASVRNESLQEIFNELSLLRKDLNGVANNFNQAVHKLHMLDNFPQFQAWVLANESLMEKLAADVKEIKVFINLTAQKWLQS